VSKIQESFTQASVHLQNALIEINEAYNEVAKWRHPVAGEIIGLIDNTHKKNR
jgi:hypothetical protein